IEAAASLHDIGKCDRRFQVLLDPLWDPSQKVLAKGDDLSRAEFERRRRISGYPVGARHEMVSAALVQTASWRPQDADFDLILHLIGTHHGFGRALAPYWSDGNDNVGARIDGEEVTLSGAAALAALDSGWTDRFAAMTRKYGWWGLAYLET